MVGAGAGAVSGRHTALAILLCAAVATGCGGAFEQDGPPQSAPEEDVLTTSAPATSVVTGHRDLRAVDVEETPVVLVVSNQSFDDPDVALTITVDGAPVVAESFPVEGQHTQTFFGLDLAPGEHTLVIASDTGATVSHAIDLPAGEARWVHVSYWYLDPAQEGVSWGGEEDPGPRLVVDVSDEMIPMA